VQRLISLRRLIAIPAAQGIAGKRSGDRAASARSPTFGSVEVIMKARLFAFALALCGTSAMAQTTIDLNVLAAESGLSTRQVGMLFGASAAYPEFKASYVQVKRKFTAAVGQQRYEALLAAYKAREEGRQVAAATAKAESGT
jgi:GrpB-like predicted nucleotidyltransferase (UPF0157 family)